MWNKILTFIKKYKIDVAYFLALFIAIFIAKIFFDLMTLLVIVACAVIIYLIDKDTGVFTKLATPIKDWLKKFKFW
jgi:hypothetical protein